MEEYAENGRVTRKEAGKAYFLRPGKMRWDYEAPEKNMFLADGKYVWFYTPADRTVTRMPSKESDDWRTPLAFLTTDMKISRVCSRVDPAVDEKPSQAGDFVYRCQLRSRSSDTGSNSSSKNTGSVVFELSPQGELNRILIVEEAGVQLEFGFKNWQWNPPLAKSLFQFDPPPGVVIVNGLLSDTPGLRQ
jgi:outer membrane lipoprotein carrier protein